MSTPRSGRTPASSASKKEGIQTISGAATPGALSKDRTGPVTSPPRGTSSSSPSRSSSSSSCARRLRDLKLTKHEEQDLRRVYDRLAGGAERDRKQNLLAVKRAECKAINDRLETEDFDEVEDGDQIEDELNDRVESLESEIEVVLSELKKLEDRTDRTISSSDLDHVLRSLGRPAHKKAVEFMIWEVDENIDGVVDWGEFQLMFHRNKGDQTGLEPFELYNLVEFMTFDRDNKGFITEDDTMSTLFVRHGRSQVEHLVANMFGEKLRAKGGEGTLSLEDYLAVASVRNPRMREHRLQQLMQQVEQLKPPRTSKNSVGVVEHEKTWRPAY